jgi:hypothetical protein
LIGHVSCGAVNTGGLIGRQMAVQRHWSAEKVDRLILSLHAVVTILVIAI